ncbi:uncharacterized protein BDZ99DRAFT_167222 [Mytilinidion resinicola]|uniref:Cysteine proteinase n=1 Tax=Mytilinidion resinicola TaxID=574789 RepID=A0A6A6Y704_9PEZI|nr:uncharacterized protein BDZ99DRAFT_167222 [Mytilinidion resinicola]KAF2803587.1 hypothetical protein BDZ99DRAFT_167222 [Mytilinidion resinicola]
MSDDMRTLQMSSKLVEDNRVLLSIALDNVASKESIHLQGLIEREHSEQDLEENMYLKGRADEFTLPPYECGSPRCTELSPATQRRTIIRMPPLLMLHLKRFNDKLKKTREHVQFPLDRLTIKLRDERSAPYKLCGLSYVA